MNIKKRAIAWGVGTLLVFLFVWQQIQSVRLGYEVEKTRKQITAQKERIAYLRLDIERKLSPAELAHVAKERLKMQPATPDAVIVLETPQAATASIGAARNTVRHWLLAAAR